MYSPHCWCPTSGCPGNDGCAPGPRRAGILARAHPKLVLEIVGDPEAVGVAAVHANEPLYAALEEARLAPADIVRCTGVIVDFLNGVVLAEAAGEVGRADRSGRDDPVRAELARRPSAQFPVQRRVLAELPTDDGGTFDVGFDLLVAGGRRAAPVTGR